MSTHKPDSSPKPARTQTAAPPRATSAGTISEREPEDSDIEDIDLDEAVDQDVDNGEVESSGQRAGMSKGNNPDKGRKLKSEE